MMIALKKRHPIAAAIRPDRGQHRARDVSREHLVARAVEVEHADGPELLAREAEIEVLLQQRRKPALAIIRRKEWRVPQPRHALRQRRDVVEHEGILEALD